jgi:hypothetical protein
MYLTRASGQMSVSASAVVTVARRVLTWLQEISPTIWGPTKLGKVVGTRAGVVIDGAGKEGEDRASGVADNHEGYDASPILSVVLGSPQVDCETSIDTRPSTIPTQSRCEVSP